jgi:hypothetical protein
MGSMRGQQDSQPELQQPEYDAGAANNEQFQGMMETQGANRQQMINRRMMRQQVMNQYMPQWQGQGGNADGFMGLLQALARGSVQQVGQQQGGWGQTTQVTPQNFFDSGSSNGA